MELGSWVDVAGYKNASVVRTLGRDKFARLLVRARRSKVPPDFYITFRNHSIMGVGYCQALFALLGIRYSVDKHAEYALLYSIAISMIKKWRALYRKKSKTCEELVNLTELEINMYYMCGVLAITEREIAFAGMKGMEQIRARIESHFTVRANAKKFVLEKGINRF
ncbi:hypothetical protein A3K34_01355 [candidate division WWE3 bacterium RIFOXYC1_FULL_40_10]|uniref:Uncharacterized protein n=1 Tax=candidate division WWE3 bacterium RIFOXYA2_FULL_46_9 TaxID=1802636 RepID=A0A1F4W205_UNCKA|nr:MAG: hypothetical protein A3K58_01355 [candidate division WWE3 bacterium RIFOXYB1_FULL_40_22]OGC61517.1 MAG: hypothetical protein A3K37_01355 [candidate division WWE3 bacterium RIFOXYA1_FULL_40_11]OGC63449.1 MAG: hypothetical protein A2264_01835 [candidate division WWE3 bacterium RIFOXYA2_FULL_46_9]OGC64802.1 MAG: hypothetical protein A2326_02100 [candidate division WWE3 bacterium RIFOXYB2_FULL_41_6]OGC65900.1 MAG: hypothetical protein A3K34_01355 [candidate division WWE3 bacterium RIFOXYC1_